MDTQLRTNENATAGQPRKLLEPKKAATARAPFSVKDPNQAAGDNQARPNKPNTRTKKTDVVKQVVKEQVKEPAVAPKPAADLNQLKIFFPEQLGIEDIDKTSKREFLCPEYAKMVFQAMLNTEEHKDFVIAKNFLADASFRPEYRERVVDWLIQVHHRFQLLQETLYSTIEVYDRYLAAVDVSRDELQLAGITAMHIAAKFEEMFAPELTDYEYISDNSITKQQIITMELKMLAVIKCRLGRPICLQFLRRNSQAGKVEPIHHGMAKYLMELSAVDYELAHIRPSMIAASALFVSFKLLCVEQNKWNATMEHYSTYTQQELMPVVRRICKLLVISVDINHYQFVRSKYKHRRMQKVTEHQSIADHMDWIQNMANEYNVDDL